jgi:penicillin-binding protein 2
MIPQGNQTRFSWIQLAVAAAFGTLILRLWQIQVLAGDHYYRKSADNFVKEIDLPAVRGRILDRKGRLLADNRPAYNIYVTPRFVTPDAITRLGDILAWSDDERASQADKLLHKRGLDRFHQILVGIDVTRDQLARVESDHYALPGVSVGAVARRYYPQQKIGAHLLGYLNQIGPDELHDRREQGYKPGDFIGRAGLERQWEPFLRGTDGTERIVVDAKGQRKPDVESSELIGGPQRIEAVAGHDIKTTIDLDLQKIAEGALAKHKSAAAVVVEVETGRVLASASHPGPNPNLLSTHMPPDEVLRMADPETRPLIDKTVRENYFPGSTFKVATMLAALENGADPDERMKCTGSLRFGRRYFHCVETHLTINLHQALAQSCNVYFYQLGDRLGLDKIAEMAQDLGYGAQTGIGLNSEVSGFIPTMAQFKNPGDFQKGFVLNTAIGQGNVKVTLMQVAMAYAAVANGGRLYVPQVVEAVERAGGEVVQEYSPRLRRTLKASPESLRRVRTALYDAVNDLKGTAWGARVPGLEVAGKTGTAQVQNRRVQGEEGAPTADHAWFASFAPYKQPEIAVVVLVEHGGFGAKAAAPVAMEIYKGYFRLKQKAAPEANPEASQ